MKSTNLIETTEQKNRNTKQLTANNKKSNTYIFKIVGRQKVLLIFGLALGRAINSELNCSE